MGGVAYNPALEGGWHGLDPLPEMDERQFEQWVALIRARTGMRLPHQRKSFLVTSLNLRMREIGKRDYQDYYDYLQSGKAGRIEWTALVDRLTVHETRFFRDSRALDFFQNYCLPRIVESNDSAIQVWSAGCSTGEEPYSLAMLIDRYLEKHNGGYFGITATDISLVSLAAGKRAIFSERKLKDLDETLKETYMVKLENGHYQVAEKLRKRICFAQMNILEAAKTPLGNMDVIYCQNLLIYFDQEKRAEILDGMVKHLKPGGILILGPGEVIEWHNSELARVTETTVLAYRRMEEVG